MFNRFREDQKCIHNLLFGFRKKHSTNHALIEITENIRKSLQQKICLWNIYSLTKSIRHSKPVITKLNHYGIRGVGNSWFKSYLSNRSQVFDSDTTEIKHGVPQGSVLGPLLFLYT